VIAWQRDLQDAKTATEVVQLARGYVASMPRDAFARLPDGCRPAFIASAEDVRECSAKLSEAYWSSRASGDGAFMQDIWSFFLRASIQLARIEEERTVS
jgi:hypothetical protein